MIVLLGYVGEKLTTQLRLPGVSGHILIGAALSPDSFGVLPVDFVRQTEPLIQLALAMVGFLIGGSLEWKRLRKLGRVVAGVLFGQFYGTILVVTLGLFLALPLLTGVSPDLRCLAIALLFGLIASATAPAATLAVIHEYRAKGPLTTTVLAVVAADDGLALATYSLLAPAAIAALALTAHAGSWEIAASAAARNGLVELLAATGLGVLGGLVGHLARRYSPANGRALPMFALSLVFYGIALEFHFNALLVSMVLGLTLANLAGRFEDIARGMRPYEDSVFTIFFVLSGAHADLTLIVMVWPIALVFVLLRLLGKVSGAYVGAYMTAAPDAIRKVAGLALLPQAGVALGLALLVTRDLHDRSTASLIMNVTLAAVLINEVAGPVCTRFALFRSGEATRTGGGQWIG